MRRSIENIALDGVTVAYRPHERAVLRRLVAAADAGACTPAAAWAQIRLIHGLKSELDAVICDDIEVAVMREGWEARERAKIEAEGQGKAA